MTGRRPIAVRLPTRRQRIDFLFGRHRSQFRTEVAHASGRLTLGHGAPLTVEFWLARNRAQANRGLVPNLGRETSITLHKLPTAGDKLTSDRKSTSPVAEVLDAIQRFTKFFKSISEISWWCEHAHRVQIISIYTWNSSQLFFVRRQLRATMTEVRAQYKQMESDFKNAVQTSVLKAAGNLTTQLESTVENSGDALAKRIDSIGGSLLARIEEGLAKFDPAEPGETVGVGTEPQRWSELQSIWVNTKNEIDERLDEVVASIADGRRRRKYDNLNRQNYQNITLQLYEDRRLGSRETDAALEMNNIFISKRNRRSAVTSDDLDHFKHLRDQWERFHIERR